MLKIVLVDDEKLDLDGLTELVPWHRFGMEVAGTFQRSQAALEFLEEHQADVLITDIQMPVLNGISLAERARELQPKLNIIFVSGYADFQYARKAVTLQAADYVLKPIEDHELFRTLQRIAGEIENEREQAVKEKTVMSALPRVTGELLNQWLKNVTEWGDEEWLTGKFKERLPCVVFVIEIDDIGWKMKGHSGGENTERMRAAWQWIVKELAACGFDVHCTVEPHRIAVIVQGDVNEHIAAMESLVGRAKQDCPSTITVGAGKTADTLEGIRLSYAQAVEALGHKMFTGKSRVIRWPLERKTMEQAKDLESVWEPLFSAILQYDLVRIDDLLQELFQVVYSFETSETVQLFAIHIFTKVDQYLNTLHENIYEILNLEWQKTGVLMHLETIFDIQSWLRRCLFEISEKLYIKRQRKNFSLLQEIEKYVDLNLEEKLTLKDVSQAFAFSPNYFGQIFKEASGESFNQYLFRKRMQLAVKLLQNPKSKIYEVATKIGYSNLAYFSKQFKDHFGVTPGDYRKQC